MTPIQADVLGPVGKLAAGILERTSILADAHRFKRTQGRDITSSFEILQLEGQWKPVLPMGRRYPEDSSSFFTSPVFGPTIDPQQ